MHIAMIGTRGVPAAYGGFETAVEEIGWRLVERGHRVTVYCRNAADDSMTEYRGMDLVHLPAVKVKVGETLSHSALSVVHAVTHRRPDAAFVFNAANAPFVPALRARGIPTAVHMDGLEWKRDKWGGRGRAYYRWAEQFAVRTADALIADAEGIADYYRDEFEVATRLISYGAPILRDAPTDRLAELGLESRRFHLVVARFEPENHVDVIVEGFASSSAEYPLVVVGSAPYAAEYTERIEAAAAGDSRIRLLGGVFDQELLDQLYANAATYLHGHSVGGTNPSLLRAMGAGTAVVAWDVVFNRGVSGDDAQYFGSTADLAREVVAAEHDPLLTARRGTALQLRAEQHYDWDIVTADYERLAVDIAAGYSTATHHRVRRTGRYGVAVPALGGAPLPVPVSAPAPAPTPVQVPVFASIVRP
ncbi:DUF1972 domain-containing protein [Agromyces atrinae]|uniref:D-inositol 3-phosphate glycosyltransferase n=2 Tax=Agromyces atrinae TaxID=592376 RepID=A0A4Q2M0F1_9MICO|nr:DUF1972 domain-containing protein [Agromyces atrinae]RXZ85168.1 glycosyltransferase family 1 protein [Agromyces atrinae]